MKRNFSRLTLEEAMGLIPTENLLPWDVNAPSRPPSDTLLIVLRRL